MGFRCRLLQNLEPPVHWASLLMFGHEVHYSKMNLQNPTVNPFLAVHTFTLVQVQTRLGMFWPHLYNHISQQPSRPPVPLA